MVTPSPLHRFNTTPITDSSIVLKAPAKINWFLIVKGLRTDGYHEIISLMQRVSVYDELIFEPSDKIEIMTEADIPIEENLIYKAAILIKNRFQGCKKLPGVRIILKKEIPVSAGLGGGSSDAATTIMGLNRLWGLNLDIKDMMRIGASIGSDVPFFFGSPAATIKGRGEVVCPVKLKRSYPLLLIKPPLMIGTKWAYSEIDHVSQNYNNNQDGKYFSKFIQFLNRGDVTNSFYSERNDLERVVIDRYPEIGEIKAMLKKNGAFFSTMSGSGPTVIGFFDSYGKAKQAMDVIPERYWCRLAETII